MTTTELMRAGLTAFVLALGTAPAAHAADRTVTPRPGTPVTWEGPAAVAANLTFAAQSYNLGGQRGTCGKQVNDYCDETLIEVHTPGFVEVRVTDVTLDQTGLLFDDFDLFLYRADDEGYARDYLADSSTSPGYDEYVVARADPGLYLVRVVYVSTAHDGFTGSALLTASASAAPVPAPQAAATPPPAAAPPAKKARPAKRRSCRISKRRPAKRRAARCATKRRATPRRRATSQRG